MKDKVIHLLKRLEEVEHLLGQPDTVKNKDQFKALTQEHSYLSDVKSCAEMIQNAEKQLADNRALLQGESDPEFTQILREDIARLETIFQTQTANLENLLVPPDPNDHLNTIMELRAGTGGEEAALFVGDCVRMYKMFADHEGWRYELLSCTPSEKGGFKEYIMVLAGKNVHRYLQYEAGTHRVQRVPETEAQGRVHTSAITIAVFAEPGEDEEVKIEEKDVKMDTFRSSGAGGQHVNTTDSAVRLTHIPTGIIVGCQEERSQHKNRDKAMRMLRAKIAEVEREKKRQQIASTRAEQVGSGDRSERIRTYNFPQNRVTDHRINLTAHNLDRVMEGDLTDIVAALVAHYHQEKLETI